MKRLKLVVLLGTVLLLGACSKSPKEEFITVYDSLSTEEYNAGEFELSIDDFKMNQTTGAAWANMLGENLKNMSLTGEFQYNEKDESFSLDADVEAFGSTIPFEMVGKENEGYISTSFVDGMLTFMDSFGVDAEADPAQVAELKGKYLSIDAEEVEAEAGERSEDVPDPEEVRGKMKAVLNKANDKSFKSEDDTVSHTFTSKEMVKIARDADLGEETEKNLGDMTMTMKINKKTKKTDCTIKMKDADYQMTMKAVVTPSKKKGAISMPKEKDIVPAEELENLFVPQELSGPVGESAWEDEEIEPITDEEFEVMYTQLEANLGAFSEDTRRGILDSYSPYLNDEQIARMEALLFPVEPAV
ncbi:hypothetical protein JZO70_16845 [Enterococcus sp. 669A]|uniref:Lipoprotein n=1 Tax=Candidatus Enterococcus moelleringii TaxID=2815325 RepID=A0ABS3LFL3_9ENTE|nr:hypothetical protein [Enterococcus sp. 669A]MBO1307845.1 hypothetical protein [Enterococcus sp. 669A]